MADTKLDRQYMLGSEGKPDYLMIARKDGAALGIKPLASIVGASKTGPLGIYVGLRLRVAAAPQKVVPLGVVSELPKAQAWDEVFPLIKFERTDDKRASSLMGAVIPKMPWEVQGLVEMMKDQDLVQKFGGWLFEHVGDPELFVVDSDDVVEWLTEVYADMFRQLAKGFPVLPQPEGEIMVGYLSDVVEAVLPAQDVKAAVSTIKGGGGPKLKIVGGLDTVPDYPKTEVPEIVKQQFDHLPNDEEEDEEGCEGCGEVDVVLNIDGLCEDCADEEDED